MLLKKREAKIKLKFFLSLSKYLIRNIDSIRFSLWKKNQLIIRFIVQSSQTFRDLRKKYSLCYFYFFILNNMKFKYKNLVVRFFNFMNFQSLLKMFEKSFDLSQPFDPLQDDSTWLEVHLSGVLHLFFSAPASALSIKESLATKIGRGHRELSRH